MITKYHTETGSIYEVDSEKMMARAARPTSKTRATAEWKRITDFTVGERLLLVWDPDEVEPLISTIPNVIRTTYTSRIVKIDPEPKAG